ncbi:sensor histidine kinase [Nocardiopsis coralliicola]
MLGLGTRALPSGTRQLVGAWRGTSATVRDGALALALAAAAFAPGLVDNGVMVGELPQRPLDAAGFALVMGQCLPLVARRTHPAACLAAAALCFAAVQVLAYPPTFASVGIVVALYSAGAHQDRHRIPSALALAAGYLVLAFALAARGSSERLADYVAFSLVMSAFAGAGALIRAWRAGEAERRRRGAELAAARERNRIARELHDVVSHHVTAIVVQADAARYLPASRHGELVSDLSGISDTGRQAMADLRRLLGVLEGPEAPGAPDAFGGPSAAAQGPAADSSADGVHELVERVRRAGQPVELAVRGERPALEPGVGLAVHRVVQEALTNAVKHARGRATAVLIDYGGDRIDIQVTTEGAGPSPARDLPSGGRGLTGLGERVRALGGEFTAGTLPRGGFVVRARLPLGGAR